MHSHDNPMDVRRVTRDKSHFEDLHHSLPNSLSSLIGCSHVNEQTTHVTCRCGVALPLIAVDVS